MTKIYINGSHSIHPALDSKDDNPRLCVDPDYKQYLDPSSARRLGKIIKRALVASKEALREADVQVPDAIITGTGLGCLEDTEKFLNNVLEDELGALSPTSFIQSTHNTISGQIALLLKCHGYNTTYAHRAFSFEQAIEDAILWLKEDSAQQVLVGCADEMPANVHRILQKIKLYKSSSGFSPLPVAGEGVHYFVLSPHKTNTSKAEILGVHYKTGGISVENEIDAFLGSLGLARKDIDAFIGGFINENYFDEPYQKVAELFPDAWHIQYKHSVGDSFTATGFAWKLVLDSMMDGCFSPSFVRKQSSKQLKKVLIYNHFNNKEHSFALLGHV